MSEPLIINWKSGEARDRIWECRNKHLIASFHWPDKCSTCAAIAQAVKKERERILKEVKEIPYKSRTATEFRRKTAAILEADHE